MRMVRKRLDDNNREKKLSLDYRVVEDITTKFLERWDIDNEVESWLLDKLEEKIDWNIALKNLKASKKNYHKQFDNDLFRELNEKVQKTLDKYKLREIEYLRKNVSEVDANHFEEIFENVMLEIPLTMFDKGVQRVTLVAFHYLLKVITRIAGNFMEVYNIKTINGTKNPTEVFIGELYDIIANNNELTRFTITIKSLIEQWLGKYSAKTKIASFYYDVLMIHPEYLIEKTLKYMLFTAIRNKNPFVLRAIFSSYITLIHKNLFSFYATKLTKIKLGYFKQLENLFTENFDLIFDQGNQANPKKFIITSMIYNYMFKNKRYLKPNFNFLTDEYVQNFFEPNYFDVFSSYRASSGMAFIDHLYFYTTSLKYTKNSILKEGNYHKISSNYFKKNVLKKNKLQVYEILEKHFRESFFHYFQDNETVNEILDNMASDLIQKLNFTHYLGPDFKQVEISYDEYVNAIEKFIFLMKKTLDHNSIQRTSLARAKYKTEG